MAERAVVRIVQINTSDVLGGAEKVSWTLHEQFSAAGHDSKLVVGFKRTDGQGVVALENAVNPLSLTGLKRSLANVVGIQYVGYPSSFDIPQHVGPWDLLIAHNLHGRYFETAAIRALAEAGPTVLNMHDMWMMTGHCAHAMGCDKWKTGCGSCCDKKIYPSIRLDVARSNLLRKKRAISGTDIAVASPAHWLLDLARSSHLNEQRMRHVPNPVDTGTFRPGDKQRARLLTGIPTDRSIVLFPAKAGLTSRWKNAELLLAALERLDQDVVLVAFGGTKRRISSAVTVIEFPDVSDEARMSACYQAADVVVLPSRAETSPLTILEAMASGTPVVATDVGGTRELIEDGVTGFLVPPDNVGSFTRAVSTCLNDRALSDAVAQAALERVRKRHAAPVVARRWIEWAEEMAGKPPSDVK